MMIAVFNILYRMPANILTAMRIQSLQDVFDILWSRHRLIIFCFTVWFMAVVISTVTAIDPNIVPLEGTRNTLRLWHYFIMVGASVVLMGRAHDSPFFYTPRHWIHYEERDDLKDAVRAASSLSIHNKVPSPIPAMLCLLVPPQRLRYNYRIGVTRYRDRVKIQLAA